MLIIVPKLINNIIAIIAMVFISIGVLFTPIWISPNALKEYDIAPADIR